MDSRWNKNVVALVSSVIAMMRLPISWTNSMADWPQVPAVSIIITHAGCTHNVVS